MRIPTRIRVGRKKYVVKREPTDRDVLWGRWTWRSVGPGSIVVAPHRSPKQQHETYLHELTHAILWDMGRTGLCKNENFVGEFAKKLNNALHSAEYE